MQTFLEIVGPAAEDDAVRADALPSAATATAAAAATTTTTNPRVTSNRSSETEHMDALMESLLRGRQRQQQRQRDPETTSRMSSVVSGGVDGNGGSNTNTEDTRFGDSGDHAARQTQQTPPVSVPIGMRDAARGRGSSSHTATARRNEFLRGSDGVGSTVRIRRSRRVSERGTGSVDGGEGGRDRDRRSGTARIRTAFATAAFIRDVMQESNEDIALSLEMVLEQLLVGGGLLPAGLVAGAVGGGGGGEDSGVQARNGNAVGDDDGGGNTEGVTADGQAGARGQGGAGARVAAVRVGGIGGGGARAGVADPQR